MPKAPKGSNNSSQKKTAPQKGNANGSNKPMSANGAGGGNNANAKKNAAIDDSDVVDEFSFEFTAEDIRRMLMDKTGNMFSSLSTVMGTGAVAAAAAANFHNPASGGATNANANHHDGPGLPPDETAFLMNQLRKQAASNAKGTKTPAEIDAATSPAAFEDFFRYMYTALQRSGGADNNKGVALPPPTSNATKATAATGLPSANQSQAAINTKNRLSQNKLINPSLLTPKQQAAAAAAAKAAGAAVNDFEDDEDESDTDAADALARLAGKSKAFRVDPSGDNGDDDGVDDEDGGSYAPEIQSLLRELQQANLAELDAVIAQTVAAADGKKSIQPVEEVDDEDEFEDDELVGSKGKKGATKGGGGPLGRKRGGTGPSFEDLDAQSQMNILQLYPELISRMSQRSAAAVTANTMGAGGKINAGGKMEMPTSLPAEHELALLALAALTGKTSVTAAAVQRSYEKSKLVGTNAAATLAAAQHVVSQFQNPNGTFNPNTAASATAADQQRQYSNADLDSDEHSYNDSNADDGMPDDGDILHKEDLRQINTLMDRLEPLTLDTVHELCQEWGVPTKSSPSETAGTPESRSNDHLFFSTSIAERMRYLSAAVVVCVAERFHHLHNSSPMCRDAKERTTMISNLVLRLGKSLKELDPKVRANFSTVFGFTTPSPSAEEVCVAVMCVGIVAFFQPVSIATLERVCEEFGINDYPQLLTDCDPDFIHDILANRLCEYFYPEIRTLARNFNASSLLSILTIHENGPGSYTCHIDNASLIGVVPKQMTISNTYNCKKMKWRAQVVLNTDQALSFITWHHNPSTYRIRATVRSSNAPKVPGLSGQNNAGGGKKGNANQSVDANATPAIPQNTNNAAEWSIPPQHIYVSVEGVVLPGQRFVIDKVVPLDIAYAALTTLQPNNGTGGSVLRIYNRPDDRLTLQFSLEILEVLESHVPPPVATATPKALNVKADGATVQELMVADAKAELKLKQEREKQEAAAAKAAKDAADKEKADQAAAAAAAAAAEAAKKKKEPPLTKAQQQTLAKQAALEKKIKTLEGLEDTGRERNAAAEVAAWALLDSEIKKSHEKKFAKQREREKKLVEELSKPDPNLQTQLSQLQQTVHAARTAVTKQNQDRTKDLKDLERLREQLGRRSKELESLRKLFDDQQAQLEEAEEEIVEVERRTAEKEAVINRREETRRLRAWDDEAPNMGGGGNNNGPQRHQQGNNSTNIPLVADPTASLLTFNPSSQQHTTGKQNRSSGHHSQSATAGLSANGRNGSNTFASNNNSNNTATNNANVTRFWADAANDAVFNPNTTQTNTSNNSRNGNGTPVSLSNNNGNNFGNSFSNSPAVLPPQSNPSPQQQQQQGRNGRNGSTQQMASTPSSQTNRGGNNASQQHQQRNASSLFGFDSAATSLAPPSPAGGSTSNAGFSLGPQSVGAVSPTPQNGHGNVQLKSGAKEWVPASSFSVTAGDSHTDSFEVTSVPQSGFTVTSSPGLPPSSGSATNPNAVPFVPRGMSMGNGQRSNSNNNASGSNSAAQQRGGSAVSLTMGSANSVYQLQQQLQMSGMGSGGGNTNNAAPGMLGMGGGVGLGGSGGYNGGGPIGLPDPYMRTQDMYGGGSPSMLGGYDNMIGSMGGSNQQQIGGGYGGGSGMHMSSGGFSNQGLGLGYGGMGGNSMDGLGLGLGPMGSGGAIGGSNGAIGQGAGAPGGDSGFQLTANAVNAGGLMIRQQQQQYQQPPYPSNSRTGSLYWGQQ